MEALKYWFSLLVLLLFTCCSVSVYGQSNDSSGFRLKVMSYNLRFGERASLEELADYIKNENPDIVALQEVDVRTNRTQAVHQNGKDFITELGYRTGMLTAYARTIDFSGGYYGVGILSRYPFEQTRKVVLPLPAGSNEQRALLVADVELPEKKRFTFVSTHLDHSSSSVRVQQVEAINEFFRQHPLPLIIAGDFNAQPDNPEINEGMNEYLQLCNNQPTFPSDDPSSKIDYIFCKPSGRWKRINSATLKSVLSDHLPVVAEVELN